MTLVVDASVAVKWLIDEADHVGARELLDSEHSLHAPDIVVVEVANVLRKKIAAAQISLEQASRGLADLSDIYDELTPSSSLAMRALALAVELNHPVYDCLYLADAERRAIPLVTDDRRLVAKANRSNITVTVLPLVDDTPSTLQ